jgi:predicted Zn finger-like uncharacterized protein
MYTQCPECGVAFRVTAEVLKMAAGKVRCGGCGVAFNALEHLSEQKPTAPARNEKAPDSDVPELKPEVPGELEADTPPQSISAEQSAALLKTLDQLAGEDIRIEDTGIEWRVLGDDEDDGDDGDDELDDQPEAEAELELIGDTGSMKFIIESEEDAPADEDAFEQASDEPTNVIDEMRFDDDTVLPDDFDEVVVAPSPVRMAEAPPPEPEPEPEVPQFDLDLSEPDEWEDLLGDFSESAAAENEVEEEVLEMADEADDEEDISVDPLDMDTQFALQAEAMGIDLSGIHETAQDESREADDEGPDEDVDELPGDDVDEESETSIEQDLIAAAFEAEAAAQANEEAGSAEALEEDLEEALEELLEDEEDDELEIDLQPEDEEEAEDDVEDIALTFDDDVEEMIETLSMSLDDEPEDEDEDDIETSGDEHAIPEMSEEEKTINMMIDQELLNIAVEDEDGFASTIVQRQPNKKIDAEIGVNEDQPERKKKDKAKKSEPPVAVETIIMEGEFVRAELDKERPAADTASSDTNNDPGFSIPLNKAKDDYARRREMTGGRPGAGIIAGIVALVLLLLVQAIHQSREALATVPAFNSAVGPIYRMIGKPLTPTWDIAGWRFEATKGDADETSEILTIYSRIGNNSDEALPYPIVHLALTDRFEDIMGSTLLEPGEYLPENADPRRLVPPGDTVDAMITINAPVADATGFKLMMCYRMASGQLRCKTEDFK